MLDDLDKKLASLDERFHKIASSLKPFELQAAEPGAADLGADDISGAFEHRETDLFLGFYTRRGIETALERYGVIELLRQRGFADPRVHLDLGDAFVHTLRVHDGPDPAPQRLLVELRVRRLAHTDEHDFAKEVRRGSSDFLLVEWLLLQDPRATFSAERPRLPGQRHPGLGVGPEVGELLQLMAERLGLAGLVAHPLYYHNAMLYALRSRFVCAATEGWFRALVRDLHGMRLAEASWACELGLIEDVEAGRAIAWTGREQVLALDRGVARHFESSAYVREREAAYRRHRFRVDPAAVRDAMRKRAADDEAAAHAV